MKQDLERIRKVVEEIYGVDLEDRTRKRGNVYAKATFSILAREHTSRNFDEIAGFIGLNHTTAVYHVHKLKPVILKYDDELFKKCENTLINADLLEIKKEKIISEVNEYNNYARKVGKRKLELI